MNNHLAGPGVVTPDRLPAGSLPEFFRHHGVMAPGIRLFRVIGFPAKSAWVSAAFVLPIIALAWSLWSTANEAIAFVAKERTGLAYVREQIVLIAATQNWRRAATASAADLPAAGEKVAAALARVAAIEQRLGAAIGSGPAFGALTARHQALASHPIAESPLATFEAHSALVEAALDLLDDTSDGSNLTLDPDLHSFYLVRAAIAVQPRLVEQLGRLRGTGNAALRSGTITPAQHDTLSNALAFLASYGHELSKSLQRAGELDPALRARLDQAGVDKVNAAFVDTVRTQLMGASPSGGADAFLAQANEAVERNYALNTRVLEALGDALDRRHARLRHALWAQVGISLCGVALALYLLGAFYRVTQGGIAEVARHLKRISGGDLTEHPRPWGRDEAAQLMTTVAETVLSLRRIVDGVRDSAGQIEVASQEIASASMDLSRRTEETAANLQRTSAAMDEMNGAVRQTAETATGASEIVGENAQVASRGGKIVCDVVTTMESIQESSGRIAEIIGVIDGIAFQTNILALNAAVEAARAGEQGRGFAVVAAEVRALAQRTAGAAREVKHLIGSSVERVETGTNVVAQAGTTMQDIVANAQRIRSLMDEISHAASEQARGLGDVSGAVQRLDTTTQQNAALVEQTAAAAAALRENASRLTQEVAYFKLA